MIKVSDYIAKRLKEVYAVDTVFMVTGGGAMHLNDSFGKFIPYVCNHHEQASAIAAEGYARVKQKLAVVNVTTGPGGLNCLNGVFGQWTDSVPVLYISGQVKYSTTTASCADVPLRQLGDQEVDIVSVVKPLTKYAKMVTEPKEIKYHLDKAIFEATTGRFGPVWLDIPMNVQSAMINEDELVDFEPTEIKIKIDDKLINSVIEKLNSAKRPLIIAGHGIRLSGQKDNFIKLVEKLNIPVVTTFNGLDLIDSGHENFVGRIGTIGQRAGNFALQNADLIIFLGTRNNVRQVSYNWENFAKNAFKIVVDIDSAELDKPTVTPDLKICADLADFIPEMLKSTGSGNSEWLLWCQQRKEKYSFENTKEYQSVDENINPYSFTRFLTEQLGVKDVLVSANATPSICLFQAGKINGQRILMNSGNASMGYDLPFAIGACIANDKKNTICLAGDGSIMMNLQELQTIKHHNLPIKIFVYNNSGYTSIKQTQQNFFDGRLTGSDLQSGVSVPDFVKIALAFGIKSVRLEKNSQLQNIVEDVLNSNEPVICEIILNSDYKFSPKLSSKVLEDGTMVSSSLEDMFPFLDKDEFEENMIRDI